MTFDDFLDLAAVGNFTLYKHTCCSITPETKATVDTAAVQPGLSLAMRGGHGVLMCCLR